MEVMKGNFETKRKVDVEMQPLPCPFCAKAKIRIAPAFTMPGHWEALCEREIDGGCGALLIRKSRDEVLLAWNSRVKT